MTVTARLTATPTPTEQPFHPKYEDVNTYVNRHLPDTNPYKGLMFDNNEALDHSLGQVCDGVNRRTPRASFRSGFASAVSKASGKGVVPKVTVLQADTLFDTIVAGCYATGHAKPYVKPVPTITEGVWTVGRDIPAGAYRSDGNLRDCYWEISKSGTNGQDIIANDLPTGGYPVVTLTIGQDFKTRGCGTWKKIG